MIKKKEFSPVMAQQVELALWEEFDDRTGEMWDAQAEQAELLDAVLNEQTVTVGRLNGIVAVLNVTALEVGDLMDRLAALELEFARERMCGRIH